jgi:hypothetical protein
MNNHDFNVRVDKIVEAIKMLRTDVERQELNQDISVDASFAPEDGYEKIRQALS